MARSPSFVMARLDRAIALSIALMQVARSSRAMTNHGTVLPVLLHCGRIP
jgi:hypothetical protein